MRADQWLLAETISLQLGIYFDCFCRVRRKIQLTLVLLAWLLATGSHWDLVQTFAWGRMIATYSQSMPIGQAIRLTFTPDNMCGVCEAVSEAKHQDSTTLPGEGKALGKIILVFQPVPSPILAVPVTADWLLDESEPVGQGRHPPAVRPPLELV
jgi:hypothetical protein